MSFNKEYFKIIKGAVSKETCQVISREFELTQDIILNGSDNTMEFPYKDEMVERSFSWYSPLAFEALSDTVIKRHVEETINEPVFPTYSYGRIYYNGAIMKRHIDRSSSELSVSLCLQVNKDYPWHLNVEKRNGEVIVVEQEPGDLIIYKGNELHHWRDSYPGNKQINAFFFYVRAKGPRSMLRYDTRPGLGLPFSTRKYNSEEQFSIFSNT